MSVNSLLYPNKISLYSGTINLSATLSGGNLTAPIITNSTALCANLYCERALYADSTGNISSPPFNITNSPSTGDILTATSSSDANWAPPLITTSQLDITNSPTMGYVLTGINANSCSWQVPGTVQGNIYGNMVTANSLVVAGPITATSGIISGNLNVSGNVNLTNNLHVNDIFSADIFANTVDTTGIIHAGGNINGDVAINVSTVVATDVNALSLNIANNAYIGGAVTGVDSLVVSGNITAAHFLGTTHGAVKATTINGASSVITGAGSFGTTLGVTGLATLGSVSTAGQITSTIATGTAPFVVSSTTRVSNLNAATCGTADIANGLKSASTTVSVSSATAPSNGQVLTASSSTAAAWVTPTVGGTGTAPYSSNMTVAAITGGDTTLLTTSNWFCAPLGRVLYMPDNAAVGQSFFVLNRRLKNVNNQDIYTLDGTLIAQVPGQRSFVIYCSVTGAPSTWVVQQLDF